MFEGNVFYLLKSFALPLSTFKSVKCVWSLQTHAQMWAFIDQVCIAEPNYA